MKAKRLVFPEKMRVEIEEFDLADTPGPGEILVEQVYSLISPGTELAMFTESHIGFPIPDFRYAKFPFRPGYASVGRAVLVGDGVEGVREGDTVYTRGKHASHMLVSEGRSALKLPEGMPLEHAPFAALAHIALTAVRLSSVRLGHTVAVFGQGMIGNFASQLMRISGAREVVGVDAVDERLEISRRCGLQTAVHSEAVDAVDPVRARTGGDGCQVTVEATGEPSVAIPAIRSAAQRGEVILLGSPRGTAEVDLYFDLHRTGVSLIGAHGARLADATRYGDPEPSELMLSFIADGRLQVEPMRTHTLRPCEAEQGFRGLIDDKAHTLGVLLDLTRW